jgi:outer membrane receptor protein involved in Fe transport
MTSDQPPRVEIVVVRSAKLPPSPADAAFSIIRLGGHAIETAPRLDDALSQVPGFSLFRRTSSLGANPTTQGVSLRGIAGSGASRALVTLDGVPQNDPFGGWVIWTGLPPEAIGDAIVVRGAGAGPYGAGALTGVVALDEASPAPGQWTLDAEGGSLGQARAAASADLAAGPGSIFLTAAAEHSDGWIPVRQGAGAADTRLTLDDAEASARFLADVGAATASARVSVHQEDRGTGLAGAASRARGASLSFTVAEPPTASALGWRAQIWTLVSDLANVSVSVAPDRSSTSLANDEYQTPAIGYGANLAVRRLLANDTFELGVDVRGDAGEDRERYAPVSGVLTFDRHAGGQSLDGGIYAEATHAAGPLLLVAGARLDGWATFDSHLIQRDIATGVESLDLRPALRGGAAPNARVGARFDVGGGDYLRAAAYSGFRIPTLNELYRPFRVGNNVTEANADLVPERLYGAEIGAGGSQAIFSWSVTAFYNRLEDAVTNVTLGFGPLVDPVAGVIPAGGVLLQRQNVGAVNAWGVEAESSARLGRALTGRAAVGWTWARVDGGSAAPQLTGLRPAETPRLTATAGLAWRARPPLTLSADLRYESARFDDDLNQHRLDPATTMDARAEWRLSAATTVFVAVENLFNVAVATGQTATGITSYGPPRTIMAGLKVSEPSR